MANSVARPGLHGCDIVKIGDLVGGGKVAIDKNATAGSPYAAQDGGYRATTMIGDRSFAHAVLSTAGAVGPVRPTAP